MVTVPSSLMANCLLLSLVLSMAYTTLLLPPWSGSVARNFSRAFPHYLVFAQLQKEKFLSDHVEHFLSVIEKFVQQLRSLDQDKIHPQEELWCVALR